jgi:transcriptional regulator with XRE-family HTH domain
MNTMPSTQQPLIPPLASAGIDRAELSRIERGVRPLSFSKRARIAQVLGCTPEELYARLKELANA